MISVGLLGVWLGSETGNTLTNTWPVQFDSTIPLKLGVVLALAGLAFGFILAPYLTLTPYRWFRRKIREISAQYLLASTIGLSIGLVIAALLALPLSFLPSPFGQVLPFVAAVFFAWAGVTTMVTRAKDLFGLINARRAGREGADTAEKGETAGYVLLDTSVIIDGRIADISRTGFIERVMLVPQFVLAEVQHFADSPDRLRRNRGQRGLEILNRLQKESLVPIQISDMDVEGVREVDAKLVKLAKKLRCPIITNDYKLNQVAGLQGVRVLNINELANTVKTVMLPGEVILVRIIQEGREPGQGVGYLDDGTMIVVEDGKRHIGDTLEAVVTRVLQTAAGRMIFAQLEEKILVQRGAR
ncbi:MAG: TRAM domain-containing protein [Chloroflexi bacterium]|nr:TRAM domain-containing protein [Chloroflexota bacterium]MBI3733667.1 TRAM domain-containing protein [Chloroflexota bacterium]